MTMPSPDTGPAPLSLTLFGPFRALVAGQPLPRLHSRKSLWLLALLALRQGRPVEREWLAGTLWPDADQDQAFANLRPVLSDLRRALGNEGARLQSPSRHTLCLDLAGADVDVLAFDAAVARKTPDALAQAVALYIGSLLEGCAEEWVPQERRIREENCLQALQTLAGAALARGDCATATEYCQRAVVLDPWRDGARRGLMEALSRSGDINAALQVYREFVTLLRADPKAAPDQETSALYARLRAEAKPRGDAPPVAASEASVPVVRGYLPHPLTDLVGREDERLEVAAKLWRSRLVTLTGPGGIGKTRLAIEVAAEAAPEFADGVWLVSLEALTDEARLEGRVAGVLGLKEESGQSWRDSLTRYLRTKRLLLVLDNCEHLRAACAQFAEHLLCECAHVRVLATSREALGITGETAWAVPPLTVPHLAYLPTNQATLVRVLAGYESVQLFVERAQAVQKSFGLTAENALAVAQICAHLEGTPLAIELAAARANVLTAAEIAARLDNHLSLSASGSNLSASGGRAGPSRQQTLRATLDWSYSLLNGPERVLLRRLSVFAGGWSLPAAESVCIGDSLETAFEAAQMLDLIASLTAKSLVVFEAHPTGGRYRFLETVRQYAAEQLAQSGGTGAIRMRHRDWFLTLAEEAEPHLRGPAQAAWLGRLDLEHDNMQAALSWCGLHPEGMQAGLRLAGALSRFWSLRGHCRAGREYLRQVLAYTEAQIKTAARVAALVGAGLLAYDEGDYSQAQALYEESLSISRYLGDKMKTAQILAAISHLAISRSEYSAARILLEESLGIFRELGDKSGTARSLSNIGLTHYQQGEYASAGVLYAESLRLFEEIGDTRSIAWTLHNQGNIANLQDRTAAARTLYEKSLDLFKEIEDKSNVAMTLRAQGNLAGRDGDYSSAQKFLEESASIHRERGERRALAWSLVNLCNALQEQEEYVAARATVQEALSLFEAIGDKAGVATAWLSLGDLMSCGGDPTGAEMLHAKSLRLSRDLNDKYIVLLNLEGLATASLITRRPQRSVRLWGASSALREAIAIDTQLSPQEQARYERQVAQAQAMLGLEAFTAAWEEGRALSWEQATACALEQ